MTSCSGWNGPSLFALLSTPCPRLKEKLCIYSSSKN